MRETDSLRCDGQKGMRKVLREAHRIVHGESHPRQHDKLANLMLDFLGSNQPRADFDSALRWEQ